MRASGAAEKLSLEDAAHRPRLRPRLHDRVRAVLSDKPLLYELVEIFGSPLNLIFPQNMEENLSTFQAAYKKHRLRGAIHFTGKPCKSLALYREAEGHDVNMDVSSAGALKCAIDTGWTGERIGATGPKNKEYVESGVRHGVLMNVDNLDELQQIVSAHAELGSVRPVRITIRLADHQSARVRFMGEEDTTFGIATTQVEQVFSVLEAHKQALDFQGFSWHASAAGDEQRIAAMENLLRLTFLAIRRGFAPTQINIGGGFPIMYADSCSEWTEYVTRLKESIMGRGPSQTWNHTGLGFRLESGALRGSPAFTNHAPVHTKGEELDRWLSFRLPSFDNACFSDILRDSLLKLAIEPGRGLLDQCGITIGRAAFTKTSPKGNRLVGLEMNRSNIHADHLKQLTEPMVVPRGDGTLNIDKEGVYYMGNLCLAHDMLQYNKTYPDHLPEAGDLIVFPNTAAYMMDFAESETLMQPVAQKVAVTENADGRRWVKDQEYRRFA